MSSVLLICAVISSLAVGVYFAQGLCALMFYVFRMHTRQVAASRVLPHADAKSLNTLRN